MHDFYIARGQKCLHGKSIILGSFTVSIYQSPITLFSTYNITKTPNKELANKDIRDLLDFIKKEIADDIDDEGYSIWRDK